MWTFVMDTLTPLKKEIEIVDSVIEGCVDLYTLTGTNVNVPQLLADRVESEIHEVSDFCPFVLKKVCKSLL